MIPVWILTFNRPVALNRQIDTFIAAGFPDINIFSNHPKVSLTEQNAKLNAQGNIKVHFNNLSDENANSYCARSWNNIFIKCFKNPEIMSGVFVQDDTPIVSTIGSLLSNNVDKYDLIWGPAGDVFFYMHRNVLKTVGWFDERYLGCYCGDADFLKRVWLQYDRDRLSVYETHDWGFIHNDIGLGYFVGNAIHQKAVDPTYVNQHAELEQLGKTNRVLEHSQGWFKRKWNTPGNGINDIGSMIQYTSPPTEPEIDWYPWFSTKHLQRYE